MSAIDSDFGFDAVFKKSAAELKLRLGRDVVAPSELFPDRRRGTITALLIFSGLGLMTLGIFAIGFSALQSDAPEIWIHRLMALAIAQCILISAVTMKFLPVLRRERLLNGFKFDLPLLSSYGRQAELEPRMASAPPPLPQPPKPTIGGQLAGRDFLEHHDGSIEIDTLVGRRRFISLDAAREFVGA